MQFVQNKIHGENLKKNSFVKNSGQTGGWAETFKI